MDRKPDRDLREVADRALIDGSVAGAYPPECEVRGILVRVGDQVELLVDNLGTTRVVDKIKSIHIMRGCYGVLSATLYTESGRTIRESNIKEMKKRELQKINKEE